MELWPQTKRRSYLAPVLIALLVVSAAGLLVSAIAYQKRLDDIRVASMDNRVWIMAQLEVDHLNLRIAANRAAAMPPDADAALAELKDSFDIFYSRVNIARAAVRQSDVGPALQAKMSGLIERRDDLADRIDALVTPDPAGLSGFSAEVTRLQDLVRDISTDTLQFYVETEDVAWQSERELLRRIHGQSLFLLAITLAAAALAWRLGQVLRQRTRAAERSAKTMSKAFEASRSGVIVTDGQGRIQQVSTLAQRILGCAEDTLLGRHLSDVIDPFDTKRCADCFEGRREPCETCLDRRTGARRAVLHRPDGSECQIELARTGDRDGNGRPMAITFIRDISDRAAAEQALLEARDEAQRHAKAKSMFLATMSHEMRTPLHGLIAALDLVSDSDLAEENRKLMRIARDCSQRVRAQINDVLEFTRLGESREIASAFRPVRVVENVLKEISVLARKRGNEISLAVEGDGADLKFEGLALTFSRAIYNLVGNAVKFTQDGRVDVTLRFERAPQGDTRLHVSVADTGIGIAPQDQARIFELFETVASPEINRTTGSGLGLSIVRLAVQQMGGQCQVQSEPGKGSVFSFDIPLVSASTDAGTNDPAIPQSGRAMKTATILVADDNEVNRTLLCEMLRRMGHQVLVAADGFEAVEAARARQFDMVLMDVSMPGMGGADATRHIRSGGASCDSVILAVTAYADPERTAWLRTAGMDGVLAKPVDSRELTDTLNRWLGQSPPHRPPAEPPGASDPLLALSGLVGAEKAQALIAETFHDIEDALTAMRRPGHPDEAEIARIHRAAGSSAVVGLTGIAGALNTAERNARSGRAQPDPDLLARISNDLAALRKRIHPQAGADVA